MKLIPALVAKGMSKVRCEEAPEMSIFKLKEISFKNIRKLPERSEGKLFMFYKTNEGYLSQIARK